MKMVVFLLMIPIVCFSQDTIKVRRDSLKNDVLDENGLTICEIGESAEYPGGMKALYEYINRSRKNVNCREEGLPKTGEVYVEFSVLKDGSVDSVKMMKGIIGCKECDDEAVRIVKAMPKWQPGRQNGMPVVQRFCVPVKF
jgi:protein TonB